MFEFSFFYFNLKNKMGSVKSKQTPVKQITDYELRQLSIQSGYSIEKIKLYYESFIADCPNGTLSKRNFRKMYHQLYPSSKSNKFCDRIFKIFDKNNDDFLDFNEFFTAITITLNGTCIDKLTCAFEIYDLKGDGVLDRNEMKIILKQIYEMLGEDNMKYSASKKVDLIFEKFDSNRNELTLDEFIQGCLKDDYLSQLFDNEKMKHFPGDNSSTNSNSYTLKAKALKRKSFFGLLTK